MVLVVVLLFADNYFLFSPNKFEHCTGLTLQIGSRHQEASIIEFRSFDLCRGFEFNVTASITTTDVTCIYL